MLLGRLNGSVLDTTPEYRVNDCADVVHWIVR